MAPGPEPHYAASHSARPMFGPCGEQLLGVVLSPIPQGERSLSWSGRTQTRGPGRTNTTFRTRRDLWGPAHLFCAGGPDTSADDEGNPRPGEDLLAQFHGALDNLERPF